MIRSLAFALAAAALAFSPLAARAEAPPKHGDSKKKPAKKPAPAPKCKMGPWKVAKSGAKVRECKTGGVLMDLDFQGVVIETQGGGV